MNLNTSSGAGAGAIDLKIVSSGAEAWSILGQLPSPESDKDDLDSNDLLITTSCDESGENDISTNCISSRDGTNWSKNAACDGERRP